MMLVSRRTSPLVGIDLLAALRYRALHLVGLIRCQGSVGSTEAFEPLIGLGVPQMANELRCPFEIRGAELL